MQRVRFIITPEALARLMGRPISIPGSEQAFYAHRDVIEVAACRKFAWRGAPTTTRTTIDALDIGNDETSKRIAELRARRSGAKFTP